MIRKALYLAMGLVLAAVPCWGITVNVETPGGNLVSTTYYTQPGDSASGSVSGAGGSVTVTTSGHVHTGLIRAENGAGGYQFSPFTGNGFFASGGASPLGATTTASSPNPKVDVFVVTKNGGLGAGTVGGNPPPTYGKINDAVQAAAVDNTTLPDWVLVDKGTYVESTAIKDFEAGSQLTSVWGAGKTVIDFSARSGTVIDVNKSPGFMIKGFSIKANEENGILALSSPGVKILGNEIEGKNKSYGILLHDSEGSTLTGNTVTNNVHGISLSESKGSTLTRNTVTNNTHGISLSDSKGSTLTSNTVTNSSYGIQVYRSDDSTVERNTVSNSGVHGISLNISKGSTLVGNTVKNSGDKGIFLLNSENGMVKSNTVTDSGQDGIHMDSSKDSTVERNTVSNSRTAIRAFDSEGVTVKDNIVADSREDGIHMDRSNGSTVERNTVRRNERGIHLYRSDDSTVKSNTVTDSGQDGIHMDSSKDSTVEGNTVRNSGSKGIWLDNSLNNMAGNNTVSNSGIFGISLGSSGNSTVKGNTVTDSGQDGIHMDTSNGSTVKSNNVTDSKAHGIELYQSDAVQITDNTVTGNGGVVGLSYFGGIFLLNSSGVILTGNNIFGNTNFGLWNGSLEAVDARSNWWGQATGPTVQTPLPGSPGIPGFGIWDAGVVQFIPFATTPFN